MTSATVAEVRVEQYTPEQLRSINFIKRWVALFGEPPRAADLNPSAARNGVQQWRIARYNAGDPETGEPFLALNTLKKPFGGSLSAAVRAAGFVPARPGPPSRAEIRGRQVDPNKLGMHPEVRIVLEAARADARAAAGKLEVRDRQLAEARERAARLDRQLRAARARLESLQARPKVETKTKVVRERVVDGTAVQRARARADKARQEAAEKVERARAGETEAKQAATRLAARLERAEATITTTRAQKAEMGALLAERTVERDRLEDRAVAAERQVDELREQVALLRARPPVVKSADREAVELAELEAREAQRARDEAEVRAARAERELRETVALVTGQARQLTSEEIAALRTDGPAGPAMLASAITELAQARRRGGRADVDAALRKVAAAAETWRGRL